jgi:hypothetical protein
MRGVGTLVHGWPEARERTQNGRVPPVPPATWDREAPFGECGKRANEPKDAQAWQVMPASVCGDVARHHENEKTKPKLRKTHRAR